MSFQTFFDEFFNLRVIEEDRAMLSTSSKMGGAFTNILPIAMLEFTSRGEPFIHPEASRF
jgi:hypothetical protein